MHARDNGEDRIQDGQFHIMTYKLAATCAFGLESVLKKEVLSLGGREISSDNGRVYFRGDDTFIAKANIFLRTADRIHIVLNEFDSADFDELFEGVRSVAWEDIINDRGRVLVKGRSKNSLLHSVPVAQSMTKKAIIDRLIQKTGKSEILEDGVLFPVEIELDNNKGRLMLNTSGEALFKRGYRTGSGDAPIKETLAAGLVLLSGWKSGEPLVDPFCGSGTIPIEAAMIRKNIPPGLNRHFLSMKWDFLDKMIWKQAAEEAVAGIISQTGPEIYGYDNDPDVIKKATENAVNAEADDTVMFKIVDIRQFKLKGQPGTVVTNPPYGERLGDRKYADEVYSALREAVSKKYGWNVNIITAHPNFQEIFGRAVKKRKLFNGNIRCNYYSYLI